MVIQETVVGIIVRLFINQSWSEFVQTADGIENTKVQLSLSHCLSAAERNLMMKISSNFFQVWKPGRSIFAYYVHGEEMWIKKPPRTPHWWCEVSR